MSIVFINYAYKYKGSNTGSKSTFQNKNIKVEIYTFQITYTFGTNKKIITTTTLSAGQPRSKNDQFRDLVSTRSTQEKIV